MAKIKDRFCQYEISFLLDDARLDNLTHAEFRVYINLWAYAVSQRRETVRFRSFRTSIARLCRVSQSGIQQNLAGIAQESLIDCAEKGEFLYVTVFGVKDLHDKLRFKVEYGEVEKRPNKDKDKEKRREEEAGFPILRIQELIQSSEFNKALRGIDSVKWIETLINNFGFDDVQAKINALNRSWQTQGLNPPGSPEKARHIILSEFKEKKERVNIADKIAAVLEAE